MQHTYHLMIGLSKRLLLGRTTLLLLFRSERFGTEAKATQLVANQRMLDEKDFKNIP